MPNESKELKCAKCGKALKHPIWICGKPYGKICASNINTDKYKNNENNNKHI
jgi:hypothetical protein